MVGTHATAARGHAPRDATSHVHCALSQKIVGGATEEEQRRNAGHRIMSTHGSRTTSRNGDDDEAPRVARPHSGKAQPDIAGMFHVMGFERDVDTAARHLLKSDGVEWVTFKKIDAYTANLVNLETARRMTPEKQAEAPKQVPTNTAMMTASTSLQRAKSVVASKRPVATA